MEIMQFFVFSGGAMEWNEDGVCNDWKDANRMVTNAKTGCPGESGAGDSVNGDRSKLTAADPMEAGFFRVSSIKCSAFRGL
jgi:hypothetical protein